MLTGVRHARTGFARSLAALALLAMVVRALVPAGFMFTPAEDGRFLKVALCAGHGPAAALLDLTTGALLDVSAGQGDDAPTNDPEGDAPCVFAVAAVLAPPEPGPALPIVIRTAFAGLPHLAFVAPGRGLAAPPPWPTGPPTTA